MVSPGSSGGNGQSCDSNAQKQIKINLKKTTLDYNKEIKKQNLKDFSSLDNW